MLTIAHTAEAVSAPPRGRALYAIVDGPVDPDSMGISAAGLRPYSSHPRAVIHRPVVLAATMTRPPGRLVAARLLTRGSRRIY